jgi:hypothetical protein
MALSAAAAFDSSTSKGKDSSNTCDYDSYWSRDHLSQGSARPNYAISGATNHIQNITYAVGDPVAVAVLGLVAVVSGIDGDEIPMPVPVVIAEEGVVSEVPPVTVALPLWDWDCVNVIDFVMPEAVVVTTLGKVSMPEEMVVLGSVKITVVLSVPDEVEEFEAEVPVCVEHAVPVDVVTGFVTDRGSVYEKVWIGSIDKPTDD